MKSIHQVFNMHKPSGVTSYDVIRKIKRFIPKKTKVGHFGTLDPFACGVLLVATGSACRLNEIIHLEYPKTYYAIGKLGIHTDTGDLTSEITNVDNTKYLTQKISKFSKEFLNSQLRENFLGDYMQSPHKYSAAKFKGRKLYEYAREGVEIVKEKKLRKIYDIEVVKYHFPYLHVRVTVSTGTYVRTLFQDFAKHFGTLGVLSGLIREKIGPFDIKNSIRVKTVNDYMSSNLTEDKDIFNFSTCPSRIIPFSTLDLSCAETERMYQNGMEISCVDQINFANSKEVWVKGLKDNLLGLGHVSSKENNEYNVKPKINFT
jgi:tRNA pseudouridine55 synthase